MASGLPEHVMTAMTQHIVAAYVGTSAGVDCPDLKPDTTFCAAASEKDRSDAVRVMREAGVLRTREELVRLQEASGAERSEWTQHDHKHGGSWALGFTPRALQQMARYAAEHGIPAASKATKRKPSVGSIWLAQQLKAS